MKLAIMQPYFFPYIGYFSLVKHTDEFVLFDSVQFIRHGFIERNRVLKQTEGWQYVQVPIVKDNGRATLIKDIQINNGQQWEEKILAQLQHYKKIAPYYYQTINLLKEIYSNCYDDIVSLNRVSLKTICSYLGIERNFPVFSKMGISVEPVNAPDEWALNICKALGVNEYWNRPGGKSFFDISKYRNAGIDIKFQEVALTPYEQKEGRPFEPGLSIIDVLMFNSSDQVNLMLDNFTFI